MYSKVIQPKIHGKTTFDNSGSCVRLVNYLNKENENAELEDIELFFNDTENNVTSDDVIHAIDNNRKGLAKNRAKYHSLVIAPDESERELIGNNKSAFKEYIREAMQLYAENFCDKNGSLGLKSKDLVWYAKVEDERDGVANNLHAHIMVSGRDRAMKRSISPNVNDKRRFNRVNWFLNVEEKFDELFSYSRQESLLKTHQIEKYGSLEDKVKYDQSKHITPGQTSTPISTRVKRQTTEIKPVSKPKNRPLNPPL